MTMMLAVGTLSNLTTALSNQLNRVDPLDYLSRKQLVLTRKQLRKRNINTNIQEYWDVLSSCTV